MILLLPDFVGYPFCYMTLMNDVGESDRISAEDYNDYWPYQSLDELAAGIVGRHQARHIMKVVGYSFGAHLAAYVASEIARQGGSLPQIFLIDPPALEGLREIGRDQILARLRQDDAYQYIFDLVDCELSNLDCMVENIWLLGRLQPPMPQSEATRIFVAQDGRDPTLTESLRRHVGDSTEFSCIQGCDHQTILKSRTLLNEMKSILTT
ncbi:MULTISPECIES: thioesterase domain-containing protein [Brenneria]|uniref:Thioesterase domain-containing protein n=1 Tax=Brenneria nigrifluens DSM 30175 = ATCC 13028 TaxID=1121120 RepID=A0A2U1UF96_9GAMM|nr:MULTISPECIES: thioesterase domain-containing protein [Brenneria]EHD22169.1 hypothetical protein BrE312_2796 [Brenneria sp. EniD312]PWC20345.1 hypothetical protein DDT54_21135 [Brenneria nigrifluens DSM 30175 = ATCC 13028]QCR05198.1 hypothetical protein EH206_13995 [Brenneria nigrifluens DSM 30175 = ATCC 13028]